MGGPWQGLVFAQAPGCAPSAGHLLWALLTPFSRGLCPLQRELGVRQLSRAGTTRGGMNRGCLNPTTPSPTCLHLTGASSSWETRCRVHSSSFHPLRKCARPSLPAQPRGCPVTLLLGLGGTGTSPGLARCRQCDLTPSLCCRCRKPLAGTGVGLARAGDICISSVYLHRPCPSVPPSLHLSPFPLPDPWGLRCRRLTADPGCLQSIRSRAGTKALCGLPPGLGQGWGGVLAPELGQTSPRDRRVMPSRPAAPARRYSPAGRGGLGLPRCPGDTLGHPDAAPTPGGVVSGRDLSQVRGCSRREMRLLPKRFHDTPSP
ncbi:uncharacterized protein LOC128916621 [Rissa tridactyla]|uniref:uncharacterized protein LOC128916621 n=1 Tax=Rissa tridactyla TaxID=75485 RepID=UPI0023BA6C5A|nr:uncharacterized protein LOC128916621 [Rissa tridactyla]